MAMEPHSHRSEQLWWALLVASLLSLPDLLSAAEDSHEAKFSVDPADKETCQANLNRIFGAIGEYRKKHEGKLPDRLSDLLPNFIHDSKDLICPYVQRKGGLRQWRREIRDLDFDPQTSYGYEFPRKEFGDDLWRGLPKRTWRDFKERQVEKLGNLGGVVPLVRCHFHQPRLNLAFNGRIYDSELYWEKNFSELVSMEEMYPARLFANAAGRQKLVAADFPPRPTRATPRSLDLTPQYNGRLTDPWQGFPGNHLAQLPSGLQAFTGVPFDVRGVIQLRGEEHELPFAFPVRVEGINVNQKFRRIHFLHGTTFDPTALKPPQTNIATYVIHFADKQVREIPIVYGQQVADWWDDPKQPWEPTDAKVAWTGRNEAADAYGKRLRIYQCAWENPLTETEVAGISFVSGATISAPFLIAITIEP